MEKIVYIGCEEMAQWEKCWLHRLEALSSKLQNRHKARCGSRSVMPVLVGEMGGGESPCGPAKLVNTKETLSQTRWEARTDTRGYPLIATSVQPWLPLPYHSTHMSVYIRLV